MTKAVLIVLDGFGIGKDSQFNAIKNAKMPFYKNLEAKYPHSKLLTHGEAVGLPAGIMGNSEVGHMTMGAGRIIYQDLSRISKAIRDHEFEKNTVLRSTIEAGAQNGRVHLMGLVSDGGVHSTMEHLFGLLELCLEMKVPRVVVHCFLDGRDTPPDSAVGRDARKEGFLPQLLRHPAFSQGVARIGSVMGRYFAMDRDKRWDRVELAYKTMTGQVTPFLGSGPEPLVIQAVKKSYESGKSDEFVEPLLLDASSAMKSGDSVVFFNFRSDRAREISQAMTDPDFKEFETSFKPSAFAGMTQYDKNLKNVKIAFPPQSLHNIFGEWLEQKKLEQLRVAETEKYAHVTFFFNGGRELPFQGEERILVPSPRDVATYDLKPEMSALAVATEAARGIRSGKYHFVLMNFANADMVGHTGNYLAALKAMETLDQCLTQVISAAESSGYHVLVTADHGNAEEMCDAEGHIHTQHTLNPVPAIWVAPNTANAPNSSRVAMKDGSLVDIMPTLCEMMNLPIPPEVTGKSLLR
jgi:2,3-bisphosphoglycerate-independent phosphoglycerate mutase